MRVLYRDGRFGSKVGQIGPKWDKSGAFSDQISVHWFGSKVGQIGPKWDKSGACLDQISVHYSLFISFFGPTVNIESICLEFEACYVRNIRGLNKYLYLSAVC